MRMTMFANLTVVSHTTLFHYIRETGCQDYWPCSIMQASAVDLSATRKLNADQLMVQACLSTYISDVCTARHLQGTHVDGWCQSTVARSSPAQDRRRCWRIINGLESSVRPPHASAPDCGREAGRLSDPPWRRTSIAQCFWVPVRR